MLRHDETLDFYGEIDNFSIRVDEPLNFLGETRNINLRDETLAFGGESNNGFFANVYLKKKKIFFVPIHQVEKNVNKY